MNWELHCRENFDFVQSYKSKFERIVRNPDAGEEAAQSAGAIRLC
jgi:hypothetical protein